MPDEKVTFRSFEEVPQYIRDQVIQAMIKTLAKCEVLPATDFGTFKRRDS